MSTGLLSEEVLVDAMEVISPIVVSAITTASTFPELVSPVCCPCKEKHETILFENKRITR